MEIGRPQRIVIVEPAEDPLRRARPTTPPDPAPSTPPEREPEPKRVAEPVP